MPDRRHPLPTTRFHAPLCAIALAFCAETAFADFIAGNVKQLPCQPPCAVTVIQDFVFDSNDPLENGFTVIKTIQVEQLPPTGPLFAFHVAAGLWPEKDLKHMGFLCLNPPVCTDLTGFDPNFVSFSDPLFNLHIPDFHGLQALGPRVPDVKFVSPLEAINWLPNRPIFTDFFANRDVANVGLVPVLFTHIPEPNGVFLIGLGLVVAGIARRRLR